jgi:3-hydroxypropanoate dehydrogenase
MSRLDAAGLKLLFREARTPSDWLAKPVEDDLLRSLYDLVKMGPTSANCCPARILFLRTPEAKARLKPALKPSSLERTMAAPVTAIIGYDLKFYDLLPRLFPGAAHRDRFCNNPEYAETTAFRNSSLQGGYFILAARALGLDCMPISSFNNREVDREFFPSGSVKSNFICNLGYGDRGNLEPRKPRLAFDEACTLL